MTDKQTDRRTFRAL